MDSKGVEKWLKHEHVPELLQFIKSNFGNEPMTPELMKAKVIEFQESKGIEKFGVIVNPIRVAMTGKTSGPGLFELMSVLGPERITKRAERAINLIS